MSAFTPTTRSPHREALLWLPKSAVVRQAAVYLMQAALVLLLALAAALIVFAAGGTKSVYPHLFYIPVVLSAYLFGIPGALLTGMACGLIAGPMMPLNRELGLEQATVAWLYRLAFFTAVGVFSAALLQTSKRHLLRHKGVAEELFQAYGKCLTTFASLVALRDEQTAHHCERVAANAVTLGRAAGLSEQELKELYWQGILHDLGKIATPSQILLKPGKLTNAEYNEIKKHAKVGADILQNISPRFRLLADGVRSHHERWDGQGYPEGLEGNQIPLNGRILAIADVFEALTSDRPYRDALPTPEACTLIEDGSGNHFDPSLVPHFLTLFNRGQILIAGDPVPGGHAADFPVPGYSVLRQEASR